MAFTKTPMGAEERKTRKRAASLKAYYRNHEENKAKMRTRDPEKRRADARSRRAANLERYRGYGRAEQVVNRIRRPWLASFNASKKRAAKKGLRFSLTREWAEKTYTGVCALTGLSFETRTEAGKQGPRPRSISIDRIDQTLGYTPENCRFILHGVNTFRGSGTDAETMFVAKALISLSADQGKIQS